MSLQQECGAGCGVATSVEWSLYCPFSAFLTHRAFPASSLQRSLKHGEQAVLDTVAF